MNSQTLAERALFLIPMVLSLSVHEWAHAWSAFKLGDDTAAREGRLTLNPLVHIDPIGTFLLPMLGVPFGWAKPVPVNPARFSRKVTMGTGMAITAAAGPLSNLLIAIVCAVGLGLLMRFSVDLRQSQALWMLLLYCVQLNVGLALFNLLPVPPLDGSRILERVVGYRHREAWATFTRVSPIVLLVVIATAGVVLAGPMEAMTELMYGLMMRVAGA